MTTGLRVILERRVAEDGLLAPGAALAVLAAFDGADALDGLLNEGPEAATAPAHAVAAATAVGAFLASIGVAGFRGIGPPVRLGLQPGPGLTLVVGRNGSGKSSFAEACELLLTGANHRWEQNRSAVWKEGWRNLQAAGEVHIECELLIEGRSAAATVFRTWPAGTDIDSGESMMRVAAGRPPERLASLGWQEPLQTFRPFLPHNELGAVFNEGPAFLFDAMSRILGLDELVDARECLRVKRLASEKSAKAVATALEPLRRALEASDDPRATEALRSLARRPWKLDAVAALLAGTTQAQDPALEGLKRLANLSLPDEAEVSAAVETLQAAVVAADAVAETDAGRAREVASLLEAAMQVHDAAGDGPCPVCGSGQLDAAWHSRSLAEIARLREEGTAAVRAEAELDRALGSCRQLFVMATRDFEHARFAGIDTATAEKACEEWSVARFLESPADLLGAMERLLPMLEASLSALREAAAAEASRRDDAWRPLARQLDAWLPDALAAAAGEAQSEPLRAAEKWLEAATGDIRAERFAPISEQAKAIWEELRQGSSVELAGLALEGTATRRRVAMDVTIDGQAGAALGVMSQGELNSLALSLFLPRAMSPESPFRFVVIDDPVQAMDPAKVDGLARVLADVAKTRQVIVFTHDDRLPESVRRLRIDARQVQVFRLEGSVVEVRDGRDPLSIYFEDADSLAKTPDLDASITRRVVPGLCRNAVEFACAESVRRRRLGRGDLHASVEDEFEQARTFNQKLALGIFDDRGRGGDVYTRVNKEFGEKGGNAIRQMNEGAHGNALFHAPDLIRDAQAIATWIRGLP